MVDMKIKKDRVVGEPVSFSLKPIGGSSFDDIFNDTASRNTLEFFNDEFKERKWAFIGVVVLDMREFDHDASQRGCLTIDHQAIPITATNRMTEDYFSDALSNIVCDEIDQIIDYDNHDDYEPGVYRYTFGCKVESSISETDCGREYDEYYVIDPISVGGYSPLDENEFYLIEQEEEEASREYWDKLNRLEQYENLDRLGYFDQQREKGQLTLEKP